MTKQQELDRARLRLATSLLDALETEEGRSRLHILDWEPEVADRAAAKELRELAIFQADRHATVKNEVEAALERMDQGLYGICEVCEAPIAKSRLKALPYARLCASCQHESENRDCRHLN